MSILEKLSNNREEGKGKYNMQNEFKVKNLTTSVLNDLKGANKNRFFVILRIPGWSGSKGYEDVLLDEHISIRKEGVFLSRHQIHLIDPFMVGSNDSRNEISSIEIRNQ